MQDGRRQKNFGRYITPKSVLNVLATMFAPKPFSRTFMAVLEILGIDTSKWNGKGDYAVVKEKAQFSYIRGGYGIYKDPLFDSSAAGLVQYKIPYGIYWFLYPNVSMDAQVSAFVSALKADKGWVLPPCADFEVTTLTQAATTAWIKLFMERVQAQIPDKFMIYTGPGWWNKNVARNTWASKYYLWVAHWTTASTPILPADWTQAFIWQYSADGNARAVEFGFPGHPEGDNDIDLNRCMNNSLFYTFVGNQNPEPLPEPLPEGALYKAFVTASVLNVRMGPNTGNAIVKQITNGTQVYVYAEYAGWGKISKNDCHWVSLSWLKR